MEEPRSRYRFFAVERCNMCGSPASRHRVMGKRLDRPQGVFPRKRIGVCTTVMKCRDCGLIFSNPQPVPFDLQDHYGVPPESYWREEYFTVSEAYFQEEIAEAKRLIGFLPGMRALDIGAGLGKAMIAMEKAGFEAHGFEPSGPFHERAISRMGLSAERLKLGSIEGVDYPEGRFHFITFGAVLEHLYDPSAAIAKALRWLAPGGIMHIEVPSSRWLVGRLINAAYRVQGLDYVGNISPMHRPFHLYEFGLTSFGRNGAHNGYAVAHHAYAVCPTYMPALVDPLLRLAMHLTGTGMQLMVWLRRTGAAEGAAPDRP
ncbi:MAG: class I SAM-dependent methyltransferase [Flavobacteriales bacterium]|nr:class I SAM-dependent methyltransferase [Flavobacteriales bacterium]